MEEGLNRATYSPFSPCDVAVAEGDQSDSNGVREPNGILPHVSGRVVTTINGSDRKRPGASQELGVTLPFKQRRVSLDTALLKENEELIGELIGELGVLRDKLQCSEKEQRKVLSQEKKKNEAYKQMTAKEHDFIYGIFKDENESLKRDVDRLNADLDNAKKNIQYKDKVMNLLSQQCMGLGSELTKSSIASIDVEKYRSSALPDQASDDLAAQLVENAKQSHQIYELIESKNNLSSSLLEVRLNMEALSKSKDDLEQRLSILNDDKSQLEGEGSGLNKRMADLQSALKTARDELNLSEISKEQLQKMSREIEGEQSKKLISAKYYANALQCQVVELIEEKKCLETRVDKLGSDMNQLSESKEGVEQNLLSINKRMSELQGENENLTKILTVKQSELDSARSDLNVSEGKVDNLEEVCGELTKENNSLKNDVGRLTPDKDRVSQLGRGLQGDLCSSDQEKTELKTKVSILESTLRRFERDCSALRVQEKIFCNKYKELKKENDFDRIKYNNAKQEKLDEINNLKAGIKILSENNRCLQENFSVLSFNVVNLTRQNMVLEAQLK
ncbi:hypothetical protein [Endozoicomonas sp.]|uniref:hypothetical protein n=1 Tax=Endozoicomonas sp. TaxID=1892382 RepID=UPI002885BC70|nr:hypothetical protein [Endozoicomonas sp.]